MYMGPVRLLRPGMTFLALALLLVILKPRLVEWKNMTAAYPSKWVLVFFGLACGSAIFGLSLGGSASYILNVYSRNLIFFFLIVIAIRNINDLALLMWSFVASVGVLVVLAQTVLDLEFTREGLGRLGGGQGMFDANDIGMILVMALPLALLFFFNGKPLTRTTVEKVRVDKVMKRTVATGESDSIEPGKEAKDKILILEDSDADGKADKTTVFADGLLIPTGVEPGDGGAQLPRAAAEIADDPLRVEQRRPERLQVDGQDVPGRVEPRPRGPDHARPRPAQPVLARRRRHRP